LDSDISGKILDYFPLETDIGAQYVIMDAQKAKMELTVEIKTQMNALFLAPKG